MHRSWLLPSALLLAACPQANQADPAAGKVPAPPAIDGRVIADGDDLYPARGRTKPLPPPPSPGTGLSDESNGKCRLFAPELKDPSCCARQLGFDVPTVQAACGLKIYLGESFLATCGYHFVADAAVMGEKPKWFRLSTVAEKTAKEAAAAHDRTTREMPGFTPSTPIPGIEGAWWSEHDDLHWAFIPGWKQVRMFTWSDASCSPEGIEKILRQLIAAPEIPAGTPRVGLVPGVAPAEAQADAKVEAQADAKVEAKADAKAAGQ
jgi:hypothetical protein